MTLPHSSRPSTYVEHLSGSHPCQSHCRVNPMVAVWRYVCAPSPPPSMVLFPSSSQKWRRALSRLTSLVLLLLTLLFGLRSTPVLPRWHVEDLCYSAESTGVRLYLNTQTPLTQRSQAGLTMLSRHSVGAYQVDELTGYSSGNARPQSPQLA